MGFGGILRGCFKDLWDLCRGFFKGFRRFGGILIFKTVLRDFNELVEGFLGS